MAWWGNALTFFMGVGCIWQLAVHPAGNLLLAVLFAAGTAAACVGWTAFRKLDVVAVARRHGPEFLLRQAHVRSGFFALACGIAFALIGRLEFQFLGLAYGDTSAGYAAGILVGLCLLCPAVLFTVGATHAAARHCKRTQLDQLRASGAALAPWEQAHEEDLVVRHWRGRHNLPRSFWLHGFALNAAVLIFSTAAGLVSTRIDVGLSAILTFGVLLAYPPIAVWQGVGIWRAARHYGRFYGRRLAPLAAQAAVVAFGVLLVHFYATGAVAQAKELLLILRGDPEWPAFSALVDPSGRNLTIHGCLQSGCHWAFERALADAPHVDTVLIDSPGGRLAEGERIAAAIRRHGLRTRAVGDCDSAATVVFLAGSQRSLAPGAQIGFHSPSLPEAPALLKLVMKFQLDFDMRAAGVSPVFVKRTLSTDPNDMWYPSPAVMRAAGVLTP